MPSVAVLAAGTWQWTALSYVATPKGGGAAVTRQTVVTPGSMRVTYNVDGTMHTDYQLSAELGRYTLASLILTTLLSPDPNPRQFPSKTLTSTVKELTATRLVLESPREDSNFNYIDTYTFAR